MSDINKKMIPELLAPAGSPEALYAAVSAGADAVYLSGRNFGARRFAKNFNEKELKEAIYFCHSRGVKVYVTLNTLISDDEMAGALNEMLFYYSSGADAVLIQDLGLLKAASESLPGLCLHASTQMTINNTPAAVWACRKGLKRIVLARELSKEAINKISDSSSDCSPELEIFVHGALCYCYSGQCLFSSLAGGRSGNRGMCAQPCRKKYTLSSCESDDYSNAESFKIIKSSGDYLISPRDLCLYEKLPDILNTGAVSLKIEGRMKSADYVALVVSVYRKALNEIKNSIWKPSEVEKEKLLFAFNRLFTGGYITGCRNKELMSQERPDNRGVCLGDVVSYDSASKTAVVRISGPYLPKSGDGLTIRRRSGKKDDGFILRSSFSVENKKFKFKSPYFLERGDMVCITKRQVVSAFAAEAACRDGGIYQKIPVDVYYFMSGKTPAVKGILSIFGRKFEIIHRASFEMADACKQPVLSSDLEKIFRKTGGIQYFVSSFTADYDEKFFAPTGLLNELRRDFYKTVEKETAESFLPLYEEIEASERNISAVICSLKRNERNVLKKTRFSFYADTLDSVRGAVSAGCMRIYFEPGIDVRTQNCDAYLTGLLSSASEICRKSDAELIWKFPLITNDEFLEFAVNFADKLCSLGISGIMTESCGAAYAVRKNYPDIKIVGSSGLNIFNSLAVSEASEIFDGISLSPELSGVRIKNLLERIPSGTKILTEYIVHGSAVLMVSENSLIKTSASNRYSDNKKPTEVNFYALCDEKGRKFPVYTDLYERTYICNSAETCLIDSLEEILDLGLDFIAADGRHRDFSYAYDVTGAYLKAMDIIASGDPQAGFITDKLKKHLRKISFGGITEGHYRRGV